MPNITTNHAITLHKFNLFSVIQTQIIQQVSYHWQRVLKSLVHPPSQRKLILEQVRLQTFVKKNLKKSKTKNNRQIYNPGQNYLNEKVFPIMSTFLRNKTISEMTPLICRKKYPSPSSMLLPRNTQGSGFLLNTQQHCFQGKGEWKETVQLRCLEKCSPSIKFSQQFCPRLQQPLWHYRCGMESLMKGFPSPH